MRTTNPALNANVFNQARSYGLGETMTLQGTVNKTFILLFIALISASWIWGKVGQPDEIIGTYQVTSQTARNVIPLMSGGAILGFICALVTIFKKEWSRVTAPLYALFEGLFLGGISAFFEMSYPGIVIQAVALTFGTMFCLLAVYKSGAIRVTDNFRLGVVSATGAICLIYLVSFVMSFFGASIPFIHSSGLLGIGFSLFVVTIAALNLVLDFDFIERATSMSVPKYMEWYAAFGLMVTLVWLYIEILRLLAKLRDRR